MFSMSSYNSDYIHNSILLGGFNVNLSNGSGGIQSGTNIGIDNTIPTAPIVNLRSPLTSQLNIGSQNIVGSTTDGRKTTSLLADANGSTNAVVQISYADTVIPIEALANSITTDTNIKTNLRWRNADPTINTFASSIETAQQNKYEQQVQVQDFLTQKETTRSDITIGGDMVNTYTSTDLSAGSVQNATREEKVNWSSGIVDTDTYTFGIGSNSIHRKTINGLTAQLSQNYNNGASQSSYVETCNSTISRTDATYNKSGINSSIEESCSFGDCRTLQIVNNGASQSTTVNNSCNITRSRVQASVTDRDIGIDNYSELLANGVYSLLNQQVLVGGITKNTVLQTSNTGASLSTNGKLDLTSTGGDVTITPKAASNLILLNLPTSSAGLPSGAVWRNGNVLNIV